MEELEKLVSELIQLGFVAKEESGLMDGGCGDWLVCVVGGLGFGWDCPKAGP